MVQRPQWVHDGYGAEPRRIYADARAPACEQDHHPTGIPARHVGPECFSRPSGGAQGFAKHRDRRHGVRIQQRGCQIAMPSNQEAIDLKQPRLQRVTDSNCLATERFLPSGSDATVMWANGLGSTQTTPSTSAQAVPAPIVDSRKVSRFCRRQGCLLSLTDTTDGVLSLPRFKYST